MNQNWAAQKATPQELQQFTKSLQDSICFEKPPLAPLIASKCELYQVGKDDLIVREGEIGSDLFFIHEGAVSVQHAGKEISQLGPGAFFGEMSLMVGGLKRTASVKAEERCRFWVLSGIRFQALMAAHKDVGQLFARVAQARKQDLK